MFDEDLCSCARSGAPVEMRMETSKQETNRIVVPSNRFSLQRSEMFYPSPQAKRGYGWGTARCLPLPLPLSAWGDEERNSTAELLPKVTTRLRSYGASKLEGASPCFKHLAPLGRSESRSHFPERRCSRSIGSNLGILDSAALNSCSW